MELAYQSQNAGLVGVDVDQDSATIFMPDNRFRWAKRGHKFVVDLPEQGNLVCVQVHFLRFLSHSLGRSLSRVVRSQFTPRDAKIDHIIM